MKIDSSGSFEGETRDTRRMLCTGAEGSAGLGVRQWVDSAEWK